MSFRTCDSHPSPPEGKEMKQQDLLSRDRGLIVVGESFCLRGIN